MSVQLIVYPQSYNGIPNPLLDTSLNYIVDGINFILVDVSSDTSIATANVVQGAIDHYTPTLSVNTWARYGGGCTGYVTAPADTLNILPGVSCVSVGIMQRLSNLISGGLYDVTVDIANASTGSGNFTMYHYSGTILQSQQVITGATAATTVTATFIANSSADTIVFDSPALAVFINSISITPSSSQPSGAIQLLEDGQVIVDLYEDEDIPLSLSVDDFKNVAEKVQSYSKAFKLPATKRNNRIFDNMFEITRADDGIIFNPYKKTKCVLKQDGFLLFDGYLKMIEITDKDGEVSYNVNLYSQVIALKDFLKERDFNTLDFYELTHSYDKDSIRDSWTGVLPLTSPLPVGTYAGTAGASTTAVLKYPFIDWSHEFIVSSGSGSSISNLPELPNLGSAFRPCIQLKYLINRIFEPTPFTWESDFFDTLDFGKLYMDFNWGGDNTPVLSDETTYNSVSFTGAGYPANYATTTFTALHLSTLGMGGFLGTTLPPNFNTGTYTITSTQVGETYNVDYRYPIENADTVTRYVECQWVYTEVGITQPVIDYTGVIAIAPGAIWDYEGVFDVELDSVGDTLQAQFKSSTTALAIRQAHTTNGLTVGGDVVFVVGALNITSGTLLQTLRGELGQWEFLKGIMTMFNLVTLVDKDNPNVLKFEPYREVFNINTSSGDVSDLTLASRSIQHDWTDKIDVGEIKLKPLTDLNKDSIFKFEEDDEDFCFMEYKRQVGGHLFGSKVFDASIAAGGVGTVLQGTKEIVAEPFAATICDTLMPQYPTIVIPKIYANGEDGTEGFDNAPRILYEVGVKDSGITYHIPAANGLTYENESDYLQFSHLTDVPTYISSPPSITDTHDFHFGECQLSNGNGNATPNNLFNLYWLPYYKELYNADTRIMSIKVNLSPSIINTFKFNDTVMIKNRQFRVNKIDYKPNDLATVEFILIP